MKRDLAKEVRKTSRREFDSAFPTAVAVYSGTIGDETESPSEWFYEETITTPSVGSTRQLTNFPLVANSVTITRISDGTEYVNGTDFTQNDVLGRITNLAMPPSISCTAAYWYRETGGGTGSGAAILAALLLVDGAGSLLDSDMVDGQHASAFAAAVHNHDLVYVKLADIGVTVASLIGGKIPTAQLPSLAINDIFTVATQAAMLALTAQRGDMAIRTDLSRTFVLSTDSPTTLADWIMLPIPASPVTSVNGQIGLVNLSAHDVGAYLQSEVYTKGQTDALIANAGADFGFKYATLVKYGL